MVVVDGKKNGGVAVKGWDRGEIFVRAKIQTWATTEAEAQAIAGQIRIETTGGQIQAEGPTVSDQQGWAVSFEVFVPRNSNLSLKAHNGGISIADVRGQIEFNALNGGVSLKRLAGFVKGQTTNGGLSIELAGSRWDGEGINVRTTNGSVNLLIPHREAGKKCSTGIDFPSSVRAFDGLNGSVGIGGIRSCPLSRRSSSAEVRLLTIRQTLMKIASADS